MRKIIGFMLVLILAFVFAGCEPPFSLAAYKVDAKKQIQDHADTKVEADYCDDNWIALCDAVIAGKVAVDIATNKVDVNSAVEAAKEKIDAVEKWELDINNVVDIRIDIDAVKTQYSMSEDLDLAGLIVKAKMNDGTLVTLRNRDFEIDESAYDKHTSGVYRIGISFAEFQANFFVMNSLTLEEKEPWEGDIYEIKERFVWEVGRIIPAPTYCDDNFWFALDKNFKNEILTMDDFKMFDNLESIEQGDHIFRNLIIIKIKNAGRGNVLETMRKMEKLDFVKGTEGLPIYYHR